MALAISQSNTSIDATGAPKKLTRDIVAGQSGGTGRSLPVELRVMITNSGGKAGDFLFVDFVLTNRGRQPIALPRSLDPREVEPTDSVPSTFEHLSLFLTAGDQNLLMLKGGADLYGAVTLSESLMTLQPSESLVVHAQVSLKPVNGTYLTGVQTLTGHASLLRETLRLKGAGLESLSEEIGEASAPPLPWTVSVVK